MSDANSRSSGTRTIMILIGMVIVFILPYGYHIDLGPGPNGFMAITWERPQGSRIVLFSALEYFIFYMYRFIVLAAIWRFSLGMMRYKRVLLHALISEFIPILISIPGLLFLNPEGENYIPIMVPLPFLLGYVTFLRFFIGNRNTS